MQSTSSQQEQGETGNTAQPSPRGDGSRIERTVWVVLLVLPLLTFCVVTLISTSIKPVPINTGDPLYDKYLAWVADGLGDNFNLEDMFGIFREDYINDADPDPFADWEAEFGGDPRYWMLRYRYSLGEEVGQWGYRPCDLGHLKKARELGVADGAILLILLSNSDTDIWDEFQYNTPGARNINSRADVEKYLRGKVDELMGAEHDQLLAELLEAAGENSLPHYYSAMFDSQRGNYQAAIAHLAEGNRAPNNSSLVGFPFEKIRSDFQSANLLPDKIISGSIIYDQMSVSLANFILVKTMVKLLSADAVDRNDRAALDEVHTFACRFGRAYGSDTIANLVGSVLAGIVEDEFANYHGKPISPELTRNLVKLGSIRGQIINTIKSGQSSVQSFGPWAMPQNLTPVWVIEAVLSGGRSYMGSSMEIVHDEFIREQATLQTVSQIFEQMETFNYNTLEFE